MRHHLQRRFNVVIQLANCQTAAALLQNGPRSFPRKEVANDNVIVTVRKSIETNTDGSGRADADAHAHHLRRRARAQLVNIRVDAKGAAFARMMVDDWSIPLCFIKQYVVDILDIIRGCNLTAQSHITHTQLGRRDGSPRCRRYRDLGAICARVYAGAA